MATKFCGVTGCNNTDNTPGIVFFRFPTHKAELDVWARSLFKDEKWRPRTFPICSLHFSVEDIVTEYSRSFLKDNAVPKYFGSLPPNFLKRIRNRKNKEAENSLLYKNRYYSDQLYDEDLPEEAVSVIDTTTKYDQGYWNLSSSRICVVAGCQSGSYKFRTLNNIKKVKFFQIPRKNLSLLSKWKKIIPVRAGLDKKFESGVICNLHFEPEDFEDEETRKKLKPRAFPTKFEETEKNFRSTGNNFSQLPHRELQHNTTKSSDEFDSLNDLKSKISQFLLPKGFYFELVGSEAKFVCIKFNGKSSSILFTLAIKPDLSYELFQDDQAIVVSQKDPIAGKSSIKKVNSISTLVKMLIGVRLTLENAVLTNSKKKTNPDEIIAEEKESAKTTILNAVKEIKKVQKEELMDEKSLTILNIAVEQIELQLVNPEVRTYSPTLAYHSTIWYRTKKEIYDEIESTNIFTIPPPKYIIGVMANLAKGNGLNAHLRAKLLEELGDWTERKTKEVKEKKEKYTPGSFEEQCNDRKNTSKILREALTQEPIIQEVEEMVVNLENDGDDLVFEL